MRLSVLIKDRGITMASLSKLSGVPYATIRDICTEKASIEKCTAETVYRLCEVLNVTMEEMLAGKLAHRQSFETFKSNICHLVKDMGDKGFISEIIKEEMIRKYYNRGWLRESLYLLAMVDYLCRENKLPSTFGYDDLRTLRFEEPIYPLGIVTLCVFGDSDKWKEKALKDAIPEFLRHNIVEAEVRNVA